MAYSTAFFVFFGVALADAVAASGLALALGGSLAPAEEGGGAPLSADAAFAFKSCGSI